MFKRQLFPQFSPKLYKKHDIQAVTLFDNRQSVRNFVALCNFNMGSQSVNPKMCNILKIADCRAKMDEMIL